MKMTKIQIISLLIVLFFVLGCTQNTPEKSDTISIDIGSMKEKTYPPDFIQDVKYLKLETNDDCVISNLDKVLFKNEQIFILDRLEHAVFVFDLEGRFVRKYYHYGKGSGEYINLWDFDLSKDGNLIYFMDNTLDKLFMYSIQDEFIKEVRLKFNTNSFACIDTSLIVFSQNNRPNTNHPEFQNNLVFWDFKKEEVIKGFLPAERKRISYTMGNSSLYSSNNQLYHCPYYGGNIYEITKKGITPFVTLTGGNFVDITDEGWRTMQSIDIIKTIRESDYDYAF